MYLNKLDEGDLFMFMDSDMENHSIWMVHEKDFGAEDTIYVVRYPCDGDAISVPFPWHQQVRPFKEPIFMEATQ